MELCVVKLDQDWFPLLDLLAIALNPNSRFVLFNMYYGEWESQRDIRFFYQKKLFL